MKKPEPLSFSISKTTAALAAKVGQGKSQKKYLFTADARQRLFLGAPFLIGCFVATHFMVDRAVNFGLGFFGVIAALSWPKLLLNREAPLRRRLAGVALIVFSLLCPALIFVIGGDLEFALLGAMVFCAVALYSLLERFQDKLPAAQLLFAPIAMGLTAVLGIRSQSMRLLWDAALLGIVPGCLFSASELALDASRFEKRGWRRFTLKPDKKNPGMVRRRPLELTQMFTLLLFASAALPALFAVLNLTPRIFLLAVLLVVLVVKPAQAFLDGTATNQDIGEKVQQAALLSLIVMLLLGLMAGG